MLGFHQPFIIQFCASFEPVAPAFRQVYQVIEMPCSYPSVKSQSEQTVTVEMQIKTETRARELITWRDWHRHLLPLPAK